MHCDIEARILNYSFIYLKNDKLLIAYTKCRPKLPTATQLSNRCDRVEAGNSPRGRKLLLAKSSSAAPSARGGTAPLPPSPPTCGVSRGIYSPIEARPQGVAENPRRRVFGLGATCEAAARTGRRRRGGVQGRAEATAADRKAWSAGRRPSTPTRRVRMGGRSREGWWVIIAKAEAEGEAGARGHRVGIGNGRSSDQTA